MMTRKAAALLLAFIGGTVAFLSLGLGAGSALAACPNRHEVEYGTTCESEKEHAEFYSFAFCPFETEELSSCLWGFTAAKEHWRAGAKASWEAENGRKPPELPSEFQAGNATVKLKLPITLRGGGIENPETLELAWVGANGAATIEPVAQAAPPLTRDVDVALLSSAERNRYVYYTKITKEKNVTATVELAGPASGIFLDEEHLLEGQGTAFAFPVKVKLTNPFLGGSCYVGSNEDPIFTEFSTGQSGELTGKVGTPVSDRAGAILTIENSTLVSNTFVAPGVQGCGEAGGADAAINAALGLPSPAGKNIAVIDGSLRQAGSNAAKRGVEGEE